MSKFKYVHTESKFSECGKYRYTLHRAWDLSKPFVMCIGLNPSNANSEKDDPTIANLRIVLSILGYGGFYMVNLYAFISSNPKDLIDCADPLGENDKYIQMVEMLCEEAIFCWGNLTTRGERIQKMIKDYPDAKCFGLNKNGTPFHPRALTYIKGALKSPQLIKYPR